jgi:hypothetical protein
MNPGAKCPLDWFIRGNRFDPHNQYIRYQWSTGSYQLQRSDGSFQQSRHHEPRCWKTESQGHQAIRTDVPGRPAFVALDLARDTVQTPRLPPGIERCRITIPIPMLATCMHSEPPNRQQLYCRRRRAASRDCASLPPAPSLIGTGKTFSREVRPLDQARIATFIFPSPESLPVTVS